MKIDPNQICYLNTDQTENIGMDGRKFVVFFLDKKSNVLFEDGEVIPWDLPNALAGVNYGVELGILTTVIYKEIDWDKV
jgi:hypothetical protein